MRNLISQAIRFYTSIAVFCLGGVFVFCSLLQTQKGLEWLRSLGPLKETFVILLIILSMSSLIGAYGYKRLKAYRTRWNAYGIMDTHPLTD